MGDQVSTLSFGPTHRFFTSIHPSDVFVCQIGPRLAPKYSPLRFQNEISTRVQLQSGPVLFVTASVRDSFRRMSHVAWSPERRILPLLAVDALSGDTHNAGDSGFLSRPTRLRQALMHMPLPQFKLPHHLCFPPPST